MRKPIDFMKRHKRRQQLILYLGVAGWTIAILIAYAVTGHFDI